jgi:cell wall-associated NlpC family hydrolase
MSLDRRLFAYRPDLADARLRDIVEADLYLVGELADVVVPVAPLSPKADPNCGIDTEVLLGETLRIFDRKDGFAFAQSERDGYVGYIPLAALGSTAQHTHQIIVPRTFLYREAELKTYPIATLSMASRLCFVDEVEKRGTKYLLTDRGEAVIARHCLPLGQVMGGDRVDVALMYLETPYLWGGRSGLGIDCSGLVQMAMAMVGEAAPRDTDMQFSALGERIERKDLSRGDLVFWKGHIGLMEDEATLLHANGHTMSVARENLDEAIQRIGWLYDAPTGYRRLKGA